MTDTSLEISGLEDLDFAIECESNYHAIAGTDKVVAIVYVVLPCCTNAYDKFMCQGCIDNIYSPDHTPVYDPDCGKVFEPLSDCVDRVVYLP